MLKNSQILEVWHNSELLNNSATVNRVIIALSHIAGLSDIKIIRCVAENQTLLANYDGTNLAKNIKNKQVPHGISNQQWHDLLTQADHDVQEAHNRGLVLKSFIEADYPNTLRDLNFKGNPSFPPMLYIKGSTDCLNQKAVAVVGTREPDAFGIDVTKRYVDLLVNRGFVIVAGLAKGIDSVAHQQAVIHHKSTVAWMAGGFDSPIYPKQNTALANDIIANRGALVWTRPFGAGVSGYDFIIRDNYQAGMSIATIAVETDIKGGTTHTMQNTLDQNKPLACPDRAKYDDIVPKISRGTDQAIKSGHAISLYTHSDVTNFVENLENNEPVLDFNEESDTNLQWFI